MVYRFFRRVR